MEILKNEDSKDFNNNENSNTGQRNEEIVKKYLENKKTDKERVNKNKKKFIIASIIIISLFLIYILSILVIIPKIESIIKERNKVEVPNLIGKTYVEAEKELSDLDLKTEKMYGSSDGNEAIVVQQNKKEGAIVQKGDTIEIKVLTQEEIEKQEQEEKEAQERNKLKPSNIEIGKTFTSMNDTNDSTLFLVSMVWDTYSSIYVNAKWVEFEVKETDGYGRYWVYMKYVKNTSDTTYSYAHSIVWWVDDTHFGKYTTIGGDIWSMKAQVKWGTKIEGITYDTDKETPLNDSSSSKSNQSLDLSKVPFHIEVYLEDVSKKYTYYGRQIKVSFAGSILNGNNFNGQHVEGDFYISDEKKEKDTIKVYFDDELVKTQEVDIKSLLEEFKKSDSKEIKIDVPL